jgi:hypothetical protein
MGWGKGTERNEARRDGEFSLSMGDESTTAGCSSGRIGYV